MRVFCAAALLALLAATPAYPQVASTEIVGAVTDASGAFLPGVTVSATQVGVGVTRSAVTDSQGTGERADGAGRPSDAEMTGTATSCCRLASRLTSCGTTDSPVTLRSASSCSLITSAIAMALGE